ncbi:alpha/beta hydrolase [Caulobacter sp. 17J65-9]|uniref:alpha/beta hydrolase n=1 Tax=Caulobacter sp. 17J65-9 TaxID=2709382 RepID=UPI0013CCD97C|nr:alpha/beta hydrolase [Caulobacter sp. 17J65-9]NEX93912.1 alpha/beta hydrolase [Caulobacter sp. 17J65-9]
MRRLLALSTIALTLAGCGRDGREPFFETRTPPQVGPRAWPPDGWAWGAIQVEGAPQVRYGVTASAGVRRAHVVILPGYGESAEVYFETVRDLTRRGYTVWVLEAAGQGGSGRFGPGRDVGRSKGFDKDAAALKALIADVIRPAGTVTVVVAAYGSGALPALLAAEEGLGRVDGLIVWSPDVTSKPADRNAARFGTGGLRVAGGKGWTRPDRDLSARSALPDAWQLANPDLRMGAPSRGWISARESAVEGVQAGAAQVALPVLTLAPQGNSAAVELCRKAPACRSESLPAGPAAAHLGPDSARTVWLQQMTSFIEERIAASHHAM